MCDVIQLRDLSNNKKPQYVYKRVQKVGEGKYISPVMGESIKLNVWKKAPQRPEIQQQGSWSLIDLLKRPYKKAYYTSSSTYAVHHDGMWGCFKSQRDAERVDLINNFVKAKGTLRIPFPAIVVKCEVKGTVHSSKYSGYDTYLVEYLKVIEEVGEPC